MKRLLATLFTAALLLSPLSNVFIVSADAARARGVIRAVDLNAKTVTIALHRDDSSLTLKTDERTEIVRNGQPARLDDLIEGDRVVAHYDDESLLARRLEATGPERPELARVEGTIAAVDLRASTVTIAPLHGGRDVTLNVTRDTEIMLDGRPARLDDLARGYTAAASYNADTFNAVRITAESFAEIRGVVRDVGYAQGTLTIEPSDGGRDGGRTVTLIVSPGTPISLNDRPATLDDLKRGYRVVASYVESTLAAVRVSAHSLGELRGVIRQVNTSAATLVIVTPNDDAVELSVTRDTAITIGGEPAPFERLQPGMSARATYDIASFVAFRVEAEPLPGGDCNEQRVVGNIAAVDTSASTVTIDPGDRGPRVTLNVTSETRIMIGDQPARLQDLQVGMRVVAHYCRGRLNALSITVRGRGGR